MNLLNLHACCFVFWPVQMFALISFLLLFFFFVRVFFFFLIAQRLISACNL